MKVVILAAGYGSRMGDLTKKFPKHMLPVAGKPILEWNIKFIKEELNLHEIIIITGHQEQIIQNYFNDGQKFGVKIKYLTQDLKKSKGLAAAVLLVKEEIKNEFIVLLGDNLYRGPYKKLIEMHKINQACVTLHTEFVKDPSRYGVVTMDKKDKNKIIELKEKPINPASNIVVTGFYIFNLEIFDAIKSIRPSKRGELELTDAINYLCAGNYKIYGEMIDGWRRDIGFENDLLDASIWMLENQEDVNVKILSNIDSSNVLIPPVFIGKNCEIKDSEIGPYTSIGNNVKIIESKIKKSIVLDNTEVIKIELNQEIASFN